MILALFGCIERMTRKRMKNLGVNCKIFFNFLPFFLAYIELMIYAIINDNIVNRYNISELKVFNGWLKFETTSIKKNFGLINPIKSSMNNGCWIVFVHYSGFQVSMDQWSIFSFAEHHSIYHCSSYFSITIIVPFILANHRTFIQPNSNSIQSSITLIINKINCNISNNIIILFYSYNHYDNWDAD